MVFLDIDFTSKPLQLTLPSNNSIEIALEDYNSFIEQSKSTITKNELYKLIKSIFNNATRKREFLPVNTIDREILVSLRNSSLNWNELRSFDNMRAAAVITLGYLVEHSKNRTEFNILDSIDVVVESLELASSIDKHLIFLNNLQYIRKAITDHVTIIEREIFSNVHKIKYMCENQLVTVEEFNGIINQYLVECQRYLQSITEYQDFIDTHLDNCDEMENTCYSLTNTKNLLKEQISSLERILNILEGESGVKVLKLIAYLNGDSHSSVFDENRYHIVIKRLYSSRITWFSF
ncbi:MAG: hypothetical protein ACXADA_13405 [Candidatus Hodarchaeales archaeon]|jgi:hypothetical protein